MKKVVTLVLVLSMVSMVSAALSISVEGNPDPVDSEIWCLPSEYLMLDINAVGEGNAVYYMLTVDNALGTISGGVLVGDASSDMTGYIAYMMPYVPLDPATNNGIVGNITYMSGVIPDITIVDLIDFHCESLDDAIVSLYRSTDTMAWTLEDTLVIHQIPEPATMALLGLGALLLRRKK